MYVELVGIPGAGKTTLVEGVRNILENSGVDCATRAIFFRPSQKRWHKIWWSVLNIWRIDFRGLHYLFLLYWRTGASSKKFFIRIHEYQKLWHQLHESKKGQVIVWDGGFVQQFANLIALGIRSEGMVFKFIQERMPPNSVLVFVNIKAEEAVRRVLRREENLVANIGVATHNKNIDGGREVLERFLRIQNAQRNLFEKLAQSGVRVEELDGSKFQEENFLLLYEIATKFKPL